MVVLVAGDGFGRIMGGQPAQISSGVPEAPRHGFVGFVTGHCRRETGILPNKRRSV